MDLGLRKKVAIVTGGTQGIGKATAECLAREGASVVIVARAEDRIAEVTGRIRDAGGSVLGISADVSRAADCGRIVAETILAFGRVDILVNNAGSSARGKFEAVTDETWQADLDLKLFAAIRLSRLVVPHMKASGSGRIINLTNIGSKQPDAGSMPTSVSRAAGLAFTKALSKEYAPHNILVNTVCIGKIRSGQHEAKAAAAGTDIESYYVNFGKDIPLGRVGLASEAANVITFLASDAASFVTGTSINLDGGASGVL